jgi:hypothetical protein
MSATCEWMMEDMGHVTGEWSAVLATSAMSA